MFMKLTTGENLLKKFPCLLILTINKLERFSCENLFSKVLHLARNLGAEALGKSPQGAPLEGLALVLSSKY